MPNYNNSKIYKIINTELKGLIYYGSTTLTLNRRFSRHKSLECSSKALFSVGTPEIILLEDYPCSSKAELIKRERYYIEGNECINHEIPGRTKKEYKQDNKEKIKETNKQYKQDNKEKIKEARKIYSDNNKEKLKEQFDCQCGIKYTYKNKARHMKTKTHTDYLNSSLVTD
tara:strand:+ start:89 stop:601 length:513 start_codon:yes stop_codon:yes gene_type:complete